MCSGFAGRAAGAAGRPRPRAPPGRRPSTSSVSSPSGAAASPIAKTWRPPVAAEPPRVERASALGGQRRGISPPLGDQDRRARRRRRRAPRRRSRACQSSSSTRVTASGPATPPVDGEDGERDGGRVGDRVGAADPGGVLGRERGEAEVRRCSRRRAPARRRRVGAGAGLAARAARPARRRRQSRGATTSAPAPTSATTAPAPASQAGGVRQPVAEVGDGGSERSPSTGANATSGDGFRARASAYASRLVD